MSEIISWDISEEGIATLKMNDTENRNIFSDDFIAELVKAFDTVVEKEPKVMILQGLPDVFSGGADKKNLMDLCDGKVHVKDLVISEKLVQAPFPVIAAMEGHAVGGGFVMAACSDIVIAARESWYGVVFMSLGFTPGMGTTTLLEDLVGTFTASEMMYTGKRYKGRKLAEMNTNINYILPKADVMKKARDIALQISQNNIKSIYLLKYALSAPRRKKLIDARLQEDFMHKLSFAYPETKEKIEELYAGM